MGEQEQFLASQYERLDDDELLRMHRSGAITDIAYAVVEQELRSRKLSIPDRPSAPVFEEPPAFLDRAPFWARLVLFILGFFTINLLYGAISSSLPSIFEGPAISPSDARAYATVEALKEVFFRGLPVLLLLKVLFFKRKKKADRARKIDT